MIPTVIRKLGLAAICGLAMNAAVADMSNIVYEDVGFIAGMDHSSNSFNIHNDTTVNDMFYRATLTDFEFTTAFDHLALMVTSGTSSLGMVHLMGGGQASFDFDATPGTYFANLVGSSSALSLYGVQIAMVPEMEVWAMMLAGMGLLGYQARRRQKS